MTPLELLNRAIPPLNTSGAKYALAGGLAASFYRTKPRLTNDVDVCLLAEPTSASQRIGEDLLKDLGLKVFSGWIAATERLANPIPMLIGKECDSESALSLDILLPTFPWLEKAVLRAQPNLIDFGFAEVPMLTPEDLLIAKQFALSIAPNRHQDKDDIQSIMAADNQLDRAYLNAELTRLGLPLL